MIKEELLHFRNNNIDLQYRLSLYKAKKCLEQCDVQTNQRLYLMENSFIHIYCDGCKLKSYNIKRELTSKEIFLLSI